MPPARAPSCPSRPPEQGTTSHLAAFPPLPSPANAPSSCLHFQAVDIGVGTFALVPAHAMVGEDKVLPVERPVFQPCRLLRKFYKLKCAKSKIPGKKRGASPAQPLHLAFWLGAHTSVTWPSKGSSNLENAERGHTYGSQPSTLPLRGEPAPSPQLTLRSSRLLAEGGKAALCLPLSIRSVLERRPEAERGRSLAERCPRAGR